MSEAKVEIKNLYKVFGERPEKMMEHVYAGMSKTDLLDKHSHILGLKDISLSMPDRKIQVIMGLSGSGKSTLIRHINRLIDPTAGEIWIDGEDVTKMNDAELRNVRRYKTSMVFQKFGLLPHRTVIQNVAYGLNLQGVADDEAEKRSMHWIERVGLNGFETNYPGQLSGGMQQRVGLARALATDAEILLMDEAFSALDPLIRTGMQNILLDLQEELHKTIIFITHDLDEALRIGDNIAILRDGMLVQDGNPQEIVMNPADEYVTEFIRDINRARVIKVGSLMDKSVDVTEGAPEIASATSIEAALPILVNAPGQVGRITAKDGSVVGSLSLVKAVEAIRPSA